MESKIHDLLLRSFDVELTSDEQNRVDEALQKSASLRREQESIRLLREAVAGEVTHSFSPFFAERVMIRIRKESGSYFEKSFGEALIAAFRPVAFAAFILILALLSFNAVRNNGAVLAGVLNSSGVGVEEAFSPTYAWIGE